MRGRITPTARSAAGADLFEVGAELVVALALIRVAQHLVRRLDLLKLVLGRRIIRVHVGMILARHLSIGLLYLLLRGGARNTQRGIVVFGH